MTYRVVIILNKNTNEYGAELWYDFRDSYCAIEFMKTLVESESENNSDILNYKMEAIPDD